VKNLVEPHPWQALRRFTPARIALGRAGNSLPTDALLDFGLAHAQARDAVHVPLDIAELEKDLSAAGYSAVTVHSLAADRTEYLRRPDLGRQLDEGGRERLRGCVTSQQPQIALVIADGLSALATMRHAMPLLQALRPHLTGWRIAPVAVASLARVALGDEIGELLGAEAVVMLIGERPGLSSHDSLGVYLTYAPRVGRTDAERNCISNIRSAGLSYDEAARLLMFLLLGARRLGRSGVSLKDDSEQSGPQGWAVNDQPRG
jgi:ethanolamine ammonia-lyase small subunit